MFLSLYPTLKPSPEINKPNQTLKVDQLSLIENQFSIYLDRIRTAIPSHLPIGLGHQQSQLSSDELESEEEEDNEYEEEDEEEEEEEEESVYDGQILESDQIGDETQEIAEFGFQGDQILNSEEETNQETEQNGQFDLYVVVSESDQEEDDEDYSIEDDDDLESEEQEYEDDLN
ncbi:hypothetical protein M0812_18093 [Anaeramoeba flamelloides]|uniref:Uncharacterized protein n=1 Tax=Anaeramoeba flamelloides TaxID=1746091 RepID=A0AAV7Z2K6_9EUKA|nr:hypothetical protein M0812_18093 [Anaeramoeba flamelloides]